MRDSRQRADEILRAAVAAEREGDLGAAAVALEEAVGMCPSRASWHHRLGVLRERLDEWVGSAEEFEAAASLDPARSSRHYRLGCAREVLWDWAGAADAFARAVSMDPKREAWSRRLENARRSSAEFRPFDGVVIAHRGSTRGRPENALEGLDRVPELIAGVEVDVRFSRDGVAVLMHDRRIDRTTHGHGAVEELSYAELGELVGGGDVRVPTLAEYLKACDGKGFQQILVDVKSPTQETLHTVATAVRASTVGEACIVMLRGEAQMRDFRRVADDLRLGGFGTRLEGVEQRISAARTYGAEVLLVAHGDGRYLSNRGAVAAIHSAGLLAGASIVNSRAALEAVRVDRCDVLLTDRADQLSYYAGCRR